MQTLKRRQLARMIERHQPMTLIEVLPDDDYDDWHLPSARNVPVDSTDFARQIVNTVEKDEPVVVYCMNSNCDASHRAAQKLDRMGYKKVFDYAAGKEDWRSAGLPIEILEKGID